ncbi:hypothetical protein IAU59_003020 [Kwoniella sp. CBS 9459]
MNPTSYPGIMSQPTSPDHPEEEGQAQLHIAEGVGAALVERQSEQNSTQSGRKKKGEERRDEKDDRKGPEIQEDPGVAVAKLGEHIEKELESNKGLAQQNGQISAQTDSTDRTGPHDQSAVTTEIEGVATLHADQGRTSTGEKTDLLEPRPSRPGLSSNRPSPPASPDPTHPAEHTPSTPPKYSAPAYHGLPKYSIPSRRPKGWISSLHHPRVASDLSPKGKVSLTPPRASSTSALPAEHTGRQSEDEEQEIPSAPRQRVTSVHAQGRQGGPGGAGGRRVSGAMQYAIAPVRHASPSSSDLEIESNGRQGSADPEAHPEADEDAILGGEEDTSLTAEDEAQIRYDVGLAQDQDEVWMSYVRAQLGALFPDFFDADPASLYPGGGSTHSRGGSRATSSAYEYLPHLDADTQQTYHHADDTSLRDTHGEEQHSQLGDVFTTSTPANTSFGMTDDTSSLATPSSVSAAGMLRGNVSIPNVREEISGLREEIMRLRSVVGGLAEGMGRPARNEMVESAEEPLVDREASDQRGSGRTATDSAVLDDEVEVGEIQDTSAGQRREAAELDTPAKNAEVNRAGGEGIKEGVKQAASELLEDQSQAGLGDVPESFKQTAHLSAQIIRALDGRLNSGLRPTADSTGAKSELRPASQRDDGTIFSFTNLHLILEYVSTFDATLGEGPSSG